MNPIERLMRMLWDRSGERGHAQDRRVRHTNDLVTKARHATHQSHRIVRLVTSYVHADGRLRR